MEYENHHPFGIDPTEDQLDKAVYETRNIYDECPPTTCNHLARCCKAGCPNMYYSEFVSIRRGAVDKMTALERINLTVECFKRYLYDQSKPKPCVFLKENNMCAIYPFRHVKCRLYGLIPDDMYKRNADEVAEEMGVPKEEVPLCNQCIFVKMRPDWKEKYPDGKMPESVIASIELRIKELDRTLGISKGFQNKGFGYLTYHDWHLLFEFGEQTMHEFTQFRKNWTAEQKEKFVADLKLTLEAQLAALSPKTEEAKTEPAAGEEVQNG